jgi:hypothetical protein
MWWFPRFCARHVLCWSAFPLAPALRSIGSAADSSALFTDFPATMAELTSHRRRLLAFPMRTKPLCRGWSDVGSPGSRPRSFRTCQVLRPRRAVQTLALTRPSLLPSASATASAPRMRIFARLNCWPMRSPRFAAALAGVRARLRVDADRIVSDFHRLLLAGLSGALRKSITSNARLQSPLDKRSGQRHGPPHQSVGRTATNRHGRNISRRLMGDRVRSVRGLSHAHQKRQLTSLSNSMWRRTYACHCTAPVRIGRKLLI